jgi:cyclic pyranopterin phosphate synthase
MPREVFGPGYRFVPRSELLRLEEISRIANIFAGQGVRKIRITGGEPLIRRDLERLVEMIAVIEGVEDISMTTNASMLTRERAQSLRAAGLKRINISLDALDEKTFQRVNDVEFPVERVLQGIEHAQVAGFDSVKINAVIRRGFNEHSVLHLANHFRGSGAILRFIEFMDVGSTNQWQFDEVVSARQMADIIHAEFPIAQISSNYRGEVAKRWRYLDGAGEVGFIASVTEPFCGDCARARLSAVGKVYTCLFATEGHDLRELIRGGASDKALARRVHAIWANRVDRYSELRSHTSATVNRAQRVEMSHIGG